MKLVVTKSLSFVTFVFLILCLSSSALAQISHAEYFFDTDPGAGNGIPIAAPADGEFNDPEETIALSGISASTLSIGYHKLYLRMRSNEGIWGTARPYPIRVTGSKTIVAAEYFIKTDVSEPDPEPGSATPIPVPVDGTYGGSVESIRIPEMNTLSLLQGANDLYVRMRDTDGFWGPARSFRFVVSAPDYVSLGQYVLDPNTAQPVDSWSWLILPSADGAYNSSPETGSTSINNTSGLAQGLHTLYVRFKDFFSRSTIKSYPFAIGRPIAVPETAPAQTTEGSGRVRVSAVVSDATGSDTCRLRVEYTADGGATYHKAAIEPGSVTATHGSPALDNAADYQIGTSAGWILTSSGPNTVTFVWLSGTDLPGTDLSNIRLRFTVNNGQPGSDLVTQSDQFEVDNEPPAPPVLIPYVPDPTGDPTPALVWNPVADVHSYRIQIDDEPAFSSPLIEAVVSGLSYTPISNLPFSRIYWRVASIDALGNLGDYSAPDDFFIVDDAEPPAVTLSYSENPAKAGPLVITATFNEDVWGPPLIAIDQAGTVDLAPTPMSSDGATWTYIYSVHPSDGSTYQDGPAEVNITGAIDSAGNPNSPAANNSFTIDTSEAGTHIITAAEYFIDDDPGEGLGIRIAAPVDGNFNGAEEDITIDGFSTTTLPIGSHTVYVRMRSSEGIWGTARPYLIRVTGEKTIVTAEYFIDSDPGEGNAIPIAGSYGASTAEVEIRDLNTSGLSEGMHTLFVRMFDSDGFWGPSRQYPFEVTFANYVKNAQYIVNPNMSQDPSQWFWLPLDPSDGSFNSMIESAAKSGIGGLRDGLNTVLIRFLDAYERPTVATRYVAMGKPIVASYEPTTQLTDGSGRVRISVIVDDATRSDTCRLKVEYSLDGNAPWTKCTIDPAGVLADYGAPVADNSEDYQVGTPAGWIMTSSGPNTVRFDWLAGDDLSGRSLSGVVLRYTVNNGQPGSDLTTTSPSFAVDTSAPPPPYLYPYLPDPTADSTPSLSWQQVDEAAHYHVQIDNDADFSSPLLDSSAVTAAEFTPSTPLPSGPVYWRVSTVDAFGNESAFSYADNFQLESDATAPFVKTLSYSRNPAPVGVLMITAIFSEPVFGPPQISIDQSGSVDLSPSAMNGAGTIWTFGYTVHAANPPEYVDGEAHVAISGAYDWAGHENESLTNAKFTIDTSSQGSGTIVGAEYYFDEDPGEGLGIPISSPADGLFDTAQEDIAAAINTSGLTSGLFIGSHRLYLRLLNSEGVWGTSRPYLIRVTGSQSIAGAEYFFDTDPGEGFGIPINAPVDESYDGPAEEIAVAAVSTSGLAEGVHHLFVRMRDAEGRWGPARQTTFQVSYPNYVKIAQYTVNPEDTSPDPNQWVWTNLTPVDGRFEETVESVFDHLIASGAWKPGVNSVHIRFVDAYGRATVMTRYFAVDAPIVEPEPPVVDPTDPGLVHLVVIVDDPDGTDLCRLRIEYSTDSSTWHMATIASGSVHADYGNPALDNSAAYQIGTPDAWILSSQGNTVRFDWKAGDDIPGVDLSTVGLRYTLNNGFAETTVPGPKPNCLLLSAPALVRYEPDPTMNRRPTLEWAPVLAAVRYRVQIDSEPGFPSPLVDTTMTLAQYTPAVSLPIGPIYWRGASINNCGYEGVFSTADSFNVIPLECPERVTPAQGETISTSQILFSWTGPSEVTEYWLLVDDDPDFSSPLISYGDEPDEPLNEPNFETAGNFLPDGQYYWNVRARVGSAEWTDCTPEPLWMFTYDLSEAATPSFVPVFRFYNGAESDHFYTTNPAEIQIAEDHGYAYEKVECYVSWRKFTGGAEFFRLYHKNDVSHKYVATLADVDSAIVNGFTYEGIAGYVYPGPFAGGVALYQQYNDAEGDYFYCINEWEARHAETLGYVDLSPAILAYVSPAGSTQPAEPLAPAVSPNEVNTNTGELIHGEQDLSVPGRNIGFVFARSYRSSSSPYRGPLGYGWTHSYNIGLVDNGDKAYVIWGDGHSEAYVPGAGGVYTPETQGVYNQLVKVSDESYTLTTKNQTTYRFTALPFAVGPGMVANLDYIEERNGNRITLVHEPDPPCRLVRIIDSANREYHFFYEDSTPANRNYISRITDPIGRELRFTYDPVTGNLIQFRNARGYTTAYAYKTARGEEHLLESMTLPRGNVRTFQYEPSDNVSYPRVTSEQEGSLPPTAFAYGQPGTYQTTVSYPAGRTEIHEYDESSRILRVLRIDPADNPPEAPLIFEYGDTHNPYKPTLMRDRRGNETHYGYSSPAPDPALPRLNWGNLLEMTNALGETASFEYDEKNNLVRSSALHAPGGPEHLTLYQYDATGNHLTDITNNEAENTHFEYNEYGQPVSVRDGNGATTFLDYDSDGNLESATDAENNITQYGYDGVGRRASVTDATLKTTFYQYDGNDNQVLVTDADSHQTALEYDPNDNLVEISYVRGGVVDVISYEYDYYDRLYRTTDPLDKIYEYTYNQASQVRNRRDANNAGINYEYDGKGRLSRVIYPDHTVEFAYDANDNRRQISDNRAELPQPLSFTYDALNRLTQTTDHFSQTVGYEYNHYGNLWRLTYPGGKSVEYGYDSVNRMASVTDWTDAVTGYDYDDSGNLRWVFNANNTTAEYIYDNASRLTGLVHRKQDSSPFASYTMTLDGVGSHTALESLNPLLPFTPEENIAYTIGQDNRLLAETGVTYEYDNNGNRTRRTAGTDVTTYGYDYENMLTQVTSPEGTVQYLYDALGNRIARIENGVTTRYVLGLGGSMSQALAEADDTNTITAYYLYGKGLVAKIMPDDTRYTYHFDSQKSTVAISDSNEDFLNFYAYDEFGKVANEREGVENKFKYFGQMGFTDEGDELFFMKARYYDAKAGRFLSHNQIGVKNGEWNLYSYFGNRPLHQAGSTGLTSVSDQIKQKENDGSDEDALLQIGLTFEMAAAPSSILRLHEKALQKRPQPGWTYGNWCGPGWSGGPGKKEGWVDEVDAACTRHDWCYAERGYFNPYCDINLLKELSQQPIGHEGRVYRYGLYTIFFFDIISHWRQIVWDAVE